MKTEFTSDDAIQLLEQMSLLKNGSAATAGSRFVSNCWLIDGDNPRTVSFVFQSLLPIDSPAMHFGEAINVSVNKELIDALRHNFFEIAEIVSEEVIDQIWNHVYRDDLQSLWTSASGAHLSICDGHHVLTVLTQPHDASAIPGDTCPYNPSEQALIDTVFRCKALVDADDKSVNFAMTIPDHNGVEIEVVFTFLSYNNPADAAVLPVPLRVPYQQSAEFTFLAGSLGFLSPFTFAEIMSKYLQPTEDDCAFVECAGTDDYILVRNGKSAMKVEFKPYSSPSTLN
jgi:hypothetical protein